MKTTIAALLVMMIIPGFAQAADITGTWMASFETQVGTQNYTFEFQVDGNTLTGTASSANGETVIESGVIDGDTISFVERLNYQGMELVITYTGEFISANEIQFKRDVGGFAVEELTATRQEIVSGQ